MAKDDPFSVARRFTALACAALALLVGSLAATTASAQDVAPAPAPVDARLVAHKARREYEQHFLWFGHRTVRDIGAGVALLGGSKPRRGVSLEPIAWKDFYLAVDRPDLARKLLTRTRLKSGFVAGGAAALAVGLALTLYAISPCTEEAEEGVVHEHTDPVVLVSPRCRPYARAGGVLSGVGGISLMIGFFTRMHPISRWVVRDMAEDYNAKLRARLGLPDELPFRLNTPAPTKRRLELALMPVLQRRSGSLSAALLF